MTSYCRRPVNFAAHERPTVGDTKFSFTDFNHMGWLKCDGAWLNKSEYGLLFNVIGGTFGETSTQFRLPDPQGRVIGAVGSHVDSNSGATFVRNKGDVDGAETHTLTIDQMPAHKHGPVDLSGNNNGSGFTTSNGLHTHTINDPGHAHGYFNQPTSHDVAVSLTTTATADNVNSNQTTGSSQTGITINSNGNHAHYMGSTGGSNLHNNMQPTLFYGNMFIYCGKVNNGSFPYKIATDLY